VSLVLSIVLTIAYPLVVWLGSGTIEPRLLAVFLGLVLLTRVRALNVGTVGRCFFLGTLALLTATIWANAVLPLKLYPVIMSTLLLIAFGYSLIVPPSMIERFARLKEPELPEPAVAYTRQVTQVWCGFFAINGMIALATAVWASPKVWWLYNGFIAYVLMGLLFTAEYLVRDRFKKRHHA
jgi:uncharacterized membrane protein